jgi:hypothetical protein
MFYIDTPDVQAVISLVFTIEAARCMCRISDQRRAAALLKMAIEAIGKDRESI